MKRCVRDRDCSITLSVEYLLRDVILAREFFREAFFAIRLPRYIINMDRSKQIFAVVLVLAIGLVCVDKVSAQG